MKALIILALVTAGSALPQQRTQRNTVFSDEKLPGEVFEFYDAFNDDLREITYEDYRLPTTTRPLHYDIAITYYFNDFSYSGVAEIDLVATQSGVNLIVIHSDLLDIQDLRLTQGTTEIDVNFTEDTVLHFLEISLTSTTLQYNAINPVVYKLIITYTGEMKDDMTGIYNSWFRNNATDTPSWMASTHMQATAARRAFPCYDEPSFKATFDFTIIRPTTHRSWSCTRIRETNLNVLPNYDADLYHTTPIMPTYLIAIIVADYEAMEVFDDEGKLVYEVIGRAAAIEEGQGTYAFDVGQELLRVMNEHTAYDFYDMNPELKMTQASIPDFSAGAMENWGLLVYREAFLMFDEEHSNSFYKQTIARILSHEIAHMWFGNLVTCNWWDNFWLNEGFARYYEYFLTHWVEVDQGFEIRFIVEQMHTAALSDSVNTHALSATGVGSPTEARAMFSTISYNKGAAVIRMTEHLLGHEVHREGLRKYLVNRAFDNALPIDLFEALQEAADQSGATQQYGDNFSISEYYETFTLQAGIPILNVRVDHQTGQITITQHRFNLNNGYSANQFNWIIPITFSTASNPDFTDTKPSHILRNAVTVIDRGTVGDEWVIFNKQQTGFYRVNYDDYTWNLIIVALRGPERENIHEYNKAQIVNDVFQYARSGIMTYTRAFSILSFLRYEKQYAPWVAAITGFNWVLNRYAGTEHLARLQDMIVDWASNLMDDLGYYSIPDESFMQSYLRYQIAPIMCSLGVRACRDAANQQFLQLRQTGAEVDPDSRLWVYCNALREGTVDDFTFLWQRYQEHNVYNEKILILNTLGCTPHQSALNVFLDAIVEENFVIRRQDYATSFSSAVTGNEVNTQYVFDYIKNNLEAVSSTSHFRFESPSTPLSYVSARLRTEAEVDDFVTWAADNQVQLGGQYAGIVSGAESTRQSIRWAVENAADINNYLVNGDEEISITTPDDGTTVPPATEPQPPIEEPSTPAVPDSASSSFLSIAIATVAVLVKLFV